MKRKRIAPPAFTLLVTIVAVAAFIVTMTGCSGTGTSSQSNTGSVALLVTDGPTSLFDAVYVTITRVELVGDGAVVPIFDDPFGKTIDLLSLQNETTLFALTSGVPTGPYEKIRLHVEKVELVKGNESYIPKLPGDGKIDLNPRMDFVVSPGDTLILQVDFDAEKSIHPVETGNGTWIFRPVVFVDILSGAYPAKNGKILKIVGIVSEKDQEGFILCRDNPFYYPVEFSWDEEERCVKVSVENASFFDAEGFPESYDDITEGEVVTVFAKPESMYTILDERRNVNHGLSGIVVGEGRLLGIRGIIRSALQDDDTFSFEIHPMTQGVFPADITARFFTGETKIYSRRGIPLSEDAIKPETYATIYGVLHADELTLNSELITVYDPPYCFKYAGIITEINADSSRFAIDSRGNVTWIQIDEDTKFVIIEETGNGYEIISGGSLSDLEPGDFAIIFGKYDATADCVLAEVVLALRR